MVPLWEPAKPAEPLRLRLNPPFLHFSGPEKRPEKRSGLETAPVITEIMSRCASETQQQQAFISLGQRVVSQTQREAIAARPSASGFDGFCAAMPKIPDQWKRIQLARKP
jgi:hypothetical protein